jgi:hypothetical protein
MMFRDIMKGVSGVCCTVVVICASGVCNGMISETSKAILPKMIVGDITFERVVSPSWIHNFRYDNNEFIVELRKNVEKISKTMEDDVESLLHLGSAVGDNPDIRNYVLEFIGGEELADLDLIQGNIYVRLLELGVVTRYWMAMGTFVNEYSNEWRNFITYRGNPISSEICLSAGYYLSALCLTTYGYIGDREPILKRLITKVNNNIPRDHYLRWAIEESLNDIELRKFVSTKYQFHFSHQNEISDF